MALEDLDFKISMDLSDAPRALQSLGQIETSVKAVSTAAANAQFNVQTFATGLRTAAVAARPLGIVSEKLGVMSLAFRSAASGANYLASAAALVVGFTKYLYVGIGLLLSPLQGLVVLAGMIGRTFAMMFTMIIAPFRILIGVVTMFFRAIMAILQPVIAVAKAFFRFQLMIAALKMQFVLMSKFLGMLPPKLRLLTVGLVALGMTGNAGAAAVRVATTAFLGLRLAVNLALLPIRAIFRPMQAAQFVARTSASALLFLAVTMKRVAVAAVQMSVAIVSRAVTGMVALTRAAISAATAVGSRLVSAAKSGAAAVTMLAAGAVAWGAKTAIAAETSTVVFGTMLKNMEQGKALVKELQNTKVSGLFDTKAIQDAGRDLFKAGVPVTQITDKLEQLGQMAVATKTPIEDLSRIYRQGMARGSFQTDLVNQMAERGIDIYHALESVTGKTGEQLADMMQKGEISGEIMNKAIAKMTTGTGIYAGAVQNVSQTTAGMLSQMGNNVTIALGNMMSSGVSGLSDLLQRGVEMTAGWKESFVSMAPVVVQIIGVITDAFGAWLSFASWVWTNIYGQGEATFGNLLAVGMDWATKFRWFFQNFGDIARFAFLQLQLFGVGAFNDIIYFFSTTIPAYLSWFSENWKQVFVDARNLIVTVFSNIATNIGSAMRAIWAYIKSGGTAELKFAFVPLLDGFKATVGELPNIPDRAMTELEKNLNGQIETLGTGLANSFDAMSAQATEALNAIPPAVQPLQDISSGGESLGSNPGETANKKAVENKASLVRSGEGQSVVAQFLKGLKGDDASKRQLKAAEKTAQHIEHIAREVDRGRPLTTRAFA